MARRMKLFELADVSSEQMTKPFEQLTNKLVNGKLLVYIFSL